MRLVTRAPRSLSIVVGWRAGRLGHHLSPRLAELDDAPTRAAWRRRSPQAAASTPAAPLKVLFLGQDQPTHSAAGIYQALGAPLARRGIQLTPVLSPARADAERLAYYDALLIYGNHTALTPDAGEGARSTSSRAARASSRCTRRRRCSAAPSATPTLIGAQSQRQGAAASSPPRSSQPSHPAVAGREALRDVGRDGRPTPSRTRPTARC